MSTQISNRTHLIVSGIVAILFLVITQVFATPLPVFRFLIPAFALYVAGVGFYNQWYLKSKDQWNVWLWLRLPFFLLTWFGLFFLIPSGLGRGTFLLFSMPVIFFFESLVGNTGQQLGWNEFLLSCAALLLTLFGFSYYFILPGVLYLAVVFLTVSILVRSSLELVPHDHMVKWIAALSLGLFTTEFFWAVSFLPLHYTALAIFTFNVLYVLWIIYYHYLYKTLTRKQIQFHLFLALLLVVVMLISTPWSIQS
ncbi:MAG TPA: hypothetical protein VHQ20_02635 [Patescibacteria group bacterium]|jgi:hypothetical protein|nr:hypothetical protein [Patescibacteria group bacterium]